MPPGSRHLTVLVSNPSLSAIFFAQKNGERRRKSSLHCAVRHNFTQNRRFSSFPRRNAMKPGHRHKNNKALLACPATAFGGGGWLSGKNKEGKRTFLYQVLFPSKQLYKLFSGKIRFCLFPDLRYYSQVLM